MNEDAEPGSLSAQGARWPGVLGLTLALLMGPVMAQEPLATGPEVGSPIPDFTAQDQYGKTRTFEDLSGPEGLLLLFHRTADW
jgi:hypothetical protein